MKEKKKTEFNREKTCDMLIIIGAVVGLVLINFLINIPFLFDFSTAPIVGKVFMIIGSAGALVGLIIGWVFIKKEGIKNLKTAIGFFTVYYLYFLLAYFDRHIWGTIMYVMIVLFAFSMTHNTYEFVAKFTGIFKGDKIAMFIISGTILLLLLGLIKDSGIDPIFIKIAIGIIYALAIPFFIKVFLLSLNNDQKKNMMIWLMLGIVLGAGTIVSFPFYVKWCGLEEEFSTFVSVYSALVGGGLTLLGVAWTIRHSQMVRQNEEKEKAKPYFQLIPIGMNVTGGQTNVDGFVAVSFYDKTSQVTEVERFLQIKNVGGLFILDTIKFNETYKHCRKTLVADNDTILFKLRLSYNVEAESIPLKFYGRDKLNNYYCFSVENKLLKQNNFFVDMESISMPIEMSEEEMQAIYKAIDTRKNDE